MYWCRTVCVKYKHMHSSMNAYFERADAEQFVSKINIYAFLREYLFWMHWCRTTRVKHKHMHASMNIFLFSFCVLPWYNHAGWLGVKHLFTSLLTLLFLVIMLVICSLFYCCQNGGEGFFIFQYVTFFPLIPSILWVLPVEKFCLLQDELEREMYRTRDNHFKVSYSSSKCIGVGRLDVLQTVQHDVFVNIAVCVCVSSWSYNIPSASV